MAENAFPVDMNAPLTGDGFALHHVGFAVPDLCDAARQWHAVTGVGPFFCFEHVPFETFTFDGEPAVFDHSTAFAVHGSTFVELQEFHSAPTALLRMLGATSDPGVNHVAYVADDPQLHAERLEQAGCRGFAFGRLGPIEVRLHDARKNLGVVVEIHRASRHLTEQFAMFRAAAASWDGRELLRSARP